MAPLALRQSRAHICWCPSALTALSIHRQLFVCLVLFCFCPSQIFLHTIWINLIYNYVDYLCYQGELLQVEIRRKKWNSAFHIHNVHPEFHNFGVSYCFLGTTGLCENPTFKSSPLTLFHMPKIQLQKRKEQHKWQSGAPQSWKEKVLTRIWSFT